MCGDRGVVRTLCAAQAQCWRGVRKFYAVRYAPPCTARLCSGLESLATAHTCAYVTLGAALASPYAGQSSSRERKKDSKMFNKINKAEENSFLQEKFDKGYILIEADRYISSKQMKPDKILQGTENYLLLYYEKDEIIIIKME